MHTPKGFTPGHVLPPDLGDDALAFAWHGDRVLMAGDAVAPRVPTLGELGAARARGGLHYLGDLDGRPFVALTLDGEVPDSATVRSRGLRALFPVLPEPLLALAARAFQVVEWDRTHRYCGRCGTPTRDKEGERARECPACGYLAYPRVSPAMMVLVTRGREVLLARANRFATGMYSALAGFVEPGETIEDCVHREVREEVGIEIEAPAYFGSQSWSFPHSLMIAFTAEYASGELRPDANEIADARWFTAANLPLLPSPVSIARRLIEATVARLGG